VTSGGAWANYLEVGAEDTATLNATINTVASSFAIVVPYLGFWLRRVTGSWFAQILCSVVIKAVSGAFSDMRFHAAANFSTHMQNALVYGTYRIIGLNALDLTNKHSLSGWQHNILRGDFRLLVFCDIGPKVAGG
jgi:hypothetical protein